MDVVSIDHGHRDHPFLGHSEAAIALGGAASGRPYEAIRVATAAIVGGNHRHVTVVSCSRVAATIDAIVVVSFFDCSIAGSALLCLRLEMRSDS